MQKKLNIYYLTTNGKEWAPSVKGEVSWKFAVISKPKNVWLLAETTK